MIQKANLKKWDKFPDPKTNKPYYKRTMAYKKPVTYTIQYNKVIGCWSVKANGKTIGWLFETAQEAANWWLYVNP